MTLIIVQLGILQLQMNILIKTAGIRLNLGISNNLLKRCFNSWILKFQMILLKDVIR